MRAVKFTLKRYLETHGLSAYRLTQAAQGRVSRGTVYALARGSVSRVDLSTLGVVMTVLEELTGQAVTPGDLLAVFTVPEPDREACVWIDGDASHLGAFEPYDWGELDPYTLGEPVRVAPDGTLLIGNE